MPKEKEMVRFIYDEAAVVVTIGETGYLVIGDLHIGTEKRFIHKGIRVYEATAAMIKKIRKLMKEFGLNSIIILGDVKDTVLYPDAAELNELKKFFDELKDYRITVTVGNHDPHLNELVNVEVKEELVLDGFAFMHGHKWPSDEAMKSRYLFVGHNHAAVTIVDKNKGFYSQKAWLIADPSKKNMKDKYPDYNKDIQLVVLPAFNDLITGMPVNEVLEKNEHLSPLFRNDVFDYKKARVFSLRGDILGTPSSLKAIGAKRSPAKSR